LGHPLASAQSWISLVFPHRITLSLHSHLFMNNMSNIYLNIYFLMHTHLLEPTAKYLNDRPWQHCSTTLRHSTHILLLLPTSTPNKHNESLANFSVICDRKRERVEEEKREKIYLQVPHSSSVIAYFFIPRTSLCSCPFQHLY
jgi:hypothetical protein